MTRMFKIKVSLGSINPVGVHEVLNSSGVQAELGRQAEQIRARTGKPADYEVSVRPGANRAHGRVATNSKEAFFKERHSNRLLKATGSGKPK